MTPEAKRELDHWLALHVKGWRIHRRNTALYCAAADEDRIIIEGKCFVATWRPTEDGAQAFGILQECARRMKHGIVGIGSPMGESDVASTLPRVKQGWIVGMIGRPSNFDIEADTLELAICRFAKELFSKPELLTAPN